jgi:hypothetical protein
MSKLIVIRIVPQAPIEASTFTGYLSNNGGLQITAFDLSFGSPTTGVAVGTAAYLAPTTGPQTSPTANPPIGFNPTPAAYGPGTGIVQQLDLQPPSILGVTVESAYYQFESVATAVLEYNPPPGPSVFENLRLVVTWGSGAGAQAISVPREYYDVPLTDGPLPDPSTWASLSSSLYLSIPAPATAGGGGFGLPANGTSPSFDSLKKAIEGVLQVDPGGAPPDLSSLTLDECRNIAYEIVWSQQPPLPTPPDPIENLYTNPQNNGQLMNGSTPNQNEGDREQFEAKLTGYYALANATADRLTPFVFSVAAAGGCEKTSLAQTQALLQFPVNPAARNSAETEVTLSGVGTPTSNFGVPAAYFYALGATMPVSMTATQRFNLAVVESLTQALADLTSALNAGVVTDSESYVTSGLPAINAAQAARRLAALNVPATAATPSLAFSAQLQPLVTAWLAFASADASPSSETYQPSDDATVFWPGAATGPTAAEFVELVLCALTQGSQIGPPTNASLAQEIATTLLPAQTVAALVAVTDAQWTTFFTNQPTWLPPFTAPGSTAVQIANFIAYLQKFFAVVNAGPVNLVTYVTTVDAPLGSVSLTFASTAGVANGMSVSGSPNIPGGEVVNGTPTATTVLLKTALTGDVPVGTNIQFKSNFVAATGGGLPLLERPSIDWLSTCLGKYQAGPFVFGTGFTLATLQTAAASVFPDDEDAQEWLVDALVTIDALYQVLAKTVPPIANNLQFSVVEALYARGFRSAADITELSSTDFPQAMVGTIAFDLAAALYTAAQLISPASQPGAPGGGFQPVNPDGSLTDCIPAPCRSPLGPINYLHEMLLVSPNDTCENPLAPPAQGQSTLGDVIAQRRGPVGQLAASCANLETPFPLIDLVNECLEFMAAAMPATSGTVYDTSVDAVAGYVFCKEGCDAEKGKKQDGHAPCCDPCHDPCTLLGALPEYSTPGTPAVSAIPLESNQNVEPLVYQNLEDDFSSCCLPYSQAIDVNRTYLKYLSTCRFEVMRTLHKCITEFVLDPINEPAGFENYVWRYPARIDIAIEYLGISAEEYERLFGGTMPRACGTPQDNRRRDAAAVTVPELYGFDPAGEDGWQQTVVQLQEFLRRTCLSYCDFVELWKSGFVTFSDGAVEGGDFPECEPCCLERHWLVFPSTDPNNLDKAVGATQLSEEQSLLELAIFIRLWRKLKDVCGACYTFAQLADICGVLQLFTSTGLNPDFIRQLAALQMLRDQFKLPLMNAKDRPAANATGADRTQMLALWVGESAAQWPWAVRQLIDGVERLARCGSRCEHRSPEFARWMESNLDDLSGLAGFDPASATDTWQSVPTHTLRFAEVLAKIFGSYYKHDELFYLFTTGALAEAGHVFPSQDDDDALESPLSLPEDEHRHSLGKLRHKLLEVCISEEQEHDWSWRRIDESLREEFGYAAAEVLAFGRHFFPGTLQSAGYVADAQQRRYSSSLPTANTTPAMWSTPHDGPFQYDATAGTLSFQLPLRDEAVTDQLERVQQLNANEQTAVQDLYYQPRAMLAGFAFLFTDFVEAQHRLIEEREEHERWRHFRRQFAFCHVRCRLSAEHLAEHVNEVTHEECAEGVGDAFLVLRELFADENAAGNWEQDAGQAPSVAWPGPNGSAFAALLGLTGTGLLREFTPAGGSVIWRDVSGPLGGFGRERDRDNCPVPTMIPSLALTLTPAQLANVTIQNGLAAEIASGAWLGGAQGFTVKWTGALLVDREGEYEFCAGAPTEECERPDERRVEPCQWRVTLTRGGRTRVVLNHNWPGQTGPTVPCPHLKHGAYDIVVEFTEPAPAFAEKKEHRLHTGFQVKYVGPDSEDRLIEIPHSRLFRVLKEMKRADENDQGGITFQDLGFGIFGLAAGAQDFLNGYYTSSLRDIRRTYQRAFKAMLFARRFELSSKRRGDGHCELGFLLANGSNFAGRAYYRLGGGGAFQQHLAAFDFNFLPIVDNYHAPTVAQDSRTAPSVQGTQAMFDWWERVYDYVQAREQVREHHDCALWALFDEAEEKQPSNPGSLLRHMGARERDWILDLRYHQDQFNPPYAVTSTDLEDDRWVIRVWHADRLVKRLLRGASAEDASEARADLWGSQDPSALVTGETVTGNANLSKFLCDRCFGKECSRRYEDVRKLNDGLRDRGRRALICYLCARDRVALPWGQGQFAETARDLSDLLLLDVETGNCERATRIEEAITAVQNFMRRARLGLEPGWPVTGDFARMWDRHFASFHVWQAYKRRHLYQENTIEWEELEKARRSEAFRFLESRLRSEALTVGKSGGLEGWPSERPPAHQGIDLLQRVEPAETRVLNPSREGFDLLATPERAAQPSWLTVTAPAQQGAAAAGGATALPYWMEAAIRMGRKFYRIAAAGVPPAGSDFKAHGSNDGQKCCAECGRVHSAQVDEYYFWLVPGHSYTEPVNSIQNGSAASTTSPDDYQYGFQDDFYSQSEQVSGWQDPTQLPQMLAWSPNRIVRLAWCRIHNSELQQSRMTSQGVVVQPTGVADLEFVGRSSDSLTFSVSNALIPSPPPVLNDSSAPGFRYDMAVDAAVVLPQVSSPQVPAVTNPGNLSSYPYFVYVNPGSHLLPLSPFSPAIAVARALRAHCSFEAALKWYRLAFDPISEDCTWIDCSQDIQPQAGRAPRDVANRDGSLNSACCDSTQVSAATARDRAILLHYLETLREWGDAAMRKNSPEHFQQARLLFDTMQRILGEAPQSIKLPEPATTQTVADYAPDFAPLNPRLMDLYNITRDRLRAIHACLNAARLINGHAACDMPYFGDSPLREGWRTTMEPCADEGDWCSLVSPYRFVFLNQKAAEDAGKVRELGGQLLAAFEKGDAEYLASLRAGHERQLMDLQLEARQDQWRDADWQVEALQKTKAVNQANLAYYKLLIQNGLISGEIAYQDLTAASIALRAAADVSEGIAGGVAAVPNTFTGGAGFGGTPLFYVQLPIGQPLAEVFSIAARIMNGLSTIAGTTAGLEQTEAGWQRRSDEWTHQVRILTIEIEQIELQILGAQRRRDQALHDLNVHQRQIEQSIEVLTFLRDKFTAHDLYLYLQKETMGLYSKMYDMALHRARQAQRSFNLERGHTTRHFIPAETWNSLQEGLMAGERLDVAVRHMEKAYLDENVREYELAKHFSLRQHFPLEYLRLRSTGYCEIDIPEWMFDTDYPGMFMRRIRNVSLTIPCVTGPFNGINCRLTLLSSVTRIVPRLDPPAHRCCCDNRRGDEYELCPCDPRAVSHYAAREAIATSSGKNDAGMFELNFRDERYLPFEYQGAISHWRVELPRENNYFDLDTVSDLILRMDYTAREGGEMLRRAANKSAARHMPGDGWCFFDVKHEFPDSWELFRNGHTERHKQLSMRLTRRMFPYVPDCRELCIDRVSLVFEVRELRETVSCGREQCTCPDARPCDSYAVSLEPHREGKDADRRRARARYVSTQGCTHVYHAEFCLEMCRSVDEFAPFFEFPRDIPEVARVFVFCHYALARESSVEVREGNLNRTCGSPK